MDYALYYKYHAKKYFIFYENEKSEKIDKIILDYGDKISQYEKSFNFLLPLLLDQFLYLNIFHSKKNILTLYSFNLLSIFFNEFIYCI